MVRGLIRNQIDKVKSTAEYYKNEAPGWLNKNLNALEEKYPKVKGEIYLKVYSFLVISTHSVEISWFFYH